MKKKLILALSLLALSGMAYGDIDGNYAERDVKVRMGLKKSTTMDVNATSVDIMMFKADGDHKTYQPVEVSISDGKPDSEQFIYFPITTNVKGTDTMGTIKELVTKTVPVPTTKFTAIGTTNNIQTYALKLDTNGKGKFAFDQTVHINNADADLGDVTTFTSENDLLVGIKQK